MCAEQLKPKDIMIQCIDKKNISIGIHARRQGGALVAYV